MSSEASVMLGPPETAGRVAPIRAECPSGARVELSATEALVLRGIAMGESDVEIARRLDMSLNSVRYSARNAVVKLGARNRPHAVLRAVAEAILVPAPPGRTEHQTTGRR